jgi:hypothetical protein
LFVIVLPMIVVMTIAVMMGVIMMLMMFRSGVGVLAIVRLGIALVVMLLTFKRLRRLRGIDACAVHHSALDPLAMAAAARVAVARTAAVAVGAVFAFFLGFAMGALVRLDQRLTVGDRDLIIIGMDFAEGEKAVPVAAILDEGGLQRRFYARDLGKVDIAAQLFALGGLEIKFFDTIATNHNDPGLFRVGGVDQHFVGHF